MGRGMQNPPPFGQMGNRPPSMPSFDPGQFSGALDQFRQDHPFPSNSGFPGARPPVPMPPPHAGGGGEISGGGMPNTQHPLNPAAGGIFPGGGHTGGAFPGGGATGGVFPGMTRGNNESGPGNTLSRSFSATGSSGANRPRGSNQ